MLSEKIARLKDLAHEVSNWWFIGLGAFAWLAVISALHYSLNFDHSTRNVIKMGYMPVITNLAAPLLDYATQPKYQLVGKSFQALEDDGMPQDSLNKLKKIENQLFIKESQFLDETKKLIGEKQTTQYKTELLKHAILEQGEGLRFEAIKFSSFAEMGDALRSGNIQAAFIIAPLSIVLRQQGADVKVVYIGNRHESTLVVRKDLKAKTFIDLKGKTIAVPIRFSGHNIATQQLIEKHDLAGQVNVVEMNPPDMAQALATGALDAYFVGEPFAAKTVFEGKSDVLYYVEQVWPNFICNLMVVRNDFIQQHPDWAKKLIHGAARSGLWAKDHIKEAATIASKYWNQPIPLIEYAMATPPNRIIFNQYAPVQKEMQFLADEMTRLKLIKTNDITGLVDDGFARSANLEDINEFEDILNNTD
jgi:NitT/TauT family transport system substrate-binding protein